MRIELAGTLIRPDPIIIRFTEDQDFDTLSYIEQGYTHFDVICIGAGGGQGGSVDTGSTLRSLGGKGGGGGFHRVRGLLSALPVSCPVVVGSPGIPGTSHASNPALTTNGSDGEASTFNGTTCRASGGEGGKRAQSSSNTVNSQADGGVGGIGNRTLVGGGALGGDAGTPSPTGPGTPGTPGQDGTFFQNIGKGGGGGAGGVFTYPGTVNVAGTAGGKGSYNPGDTSIYGSGELAVLDSPGRAGGAKGSPLNGLPTLFGRSGEAGTVIIRLTTE